MLNCIEGLLGMWPWCHKSPDPAFAVHVWQCFAWWKTVRVWLYRDVATVARDVVHLPGQANLQQLERCNWVMIMQICTA